MSPAMNSAVNWATIVGTAAALVGLAVALGLGTARAQIFLLGLTRSRTIGRALRRLDKQRRGPANFAARINLKARFWRRFNRLTRLLLIERVTFGAPRVVEELTCVSQVLDLSGDEPTITGVRTVPLPLTFAPNFKEWGEPYLDDLARAFDGYAASIRRRWLIRTAAGPLATEEYECARRTSARLTELARHKSIGLDEAHLDRAALSEWLSLGTASSEPSAQVLATRLVAWPAMRTGRGDRVFAGLTTSYTPFRVVRPGSPGARTAGTRQTLVVPWGDHKPPAGPHFDGITSRLHGYPGYRLELDEHSGRQSLHLSVSETSYFAFSGTQWAEHRPEALGSYAYCAQLLSVNVLLVDDSGKVVLVQRSKATTHPGGFAGAVSGTCELVDREGMRADLDADGFPDPMATAIREAREELGLDISSAQSRLGALGLIKVRTQHDLNTHVLVLTARLGVAAEDFRLRPGSTDDVEGTWELGGQSMIVDLPAAMSSPRRLVDFVRWLRSAEELLPHGAGSLLLLLVTHLEGQEARSAPGPTTIADLLKALAEPALTSTAPRPRGVRFQPLWAE